MSGLWATCIGVYGYCDPVSTTCDTRPTGTGCSSNVQCRSGYCDQVSTNECVATSCETGVTDGDETDIDCGNTHSIYHELSHIFFMCIAQI